MNKKYFIIIALLSLFYSTAKAQTYVPNMPATLPDVEVYDTSGVHTTLQQLAKNKVLFIDCWFIPCPPCFLAMGPLHQIYAQYSSNKNLCFITICMTDSAQVKAFIRQDTAMHAAVSQYQYFSGQTAFKLPVYFMPGCVMTMPMGTKSLGHTDPADPGKCPTTIFSFPSCPTSFIFNRQGKLVFKHEGIEDNQSYTQQLTQALNAALADGK